MPGPFGRAGLALLASVGLIGMYSFSFTFAQATPEPHRVPVAVVTTGAGAALAERIETTHRSEYEVRRVADRAAALSLIDDRDVYAALVPAARGPHLLLAPAAGKRTSEILGRRLPAAAGLAIPPQTEIVRPLARRDPDGVALDYAIFPLLIFGIVMPLLLTTVAPGLPIRLRLPYLVAYALAGGLAAMLVVNVALDALPGPLGWEIGAAVLALLAVAAITTMLIGLLGPPGVVVAVLLILITGNASAGTLLAHELTPGFYRVVGPWLPPGAIAQALRNLAYFDAADVARPLLTLAGYVLVGLTGGVLLGDRRPAAQGSPSGPTPDSSGDAALGKAGT
jgi:hypothetical protein